MIQERRSFIWEANKIFGVGFARHTPNKPINSMYIRVRHSFVSLDG